MLENDIFLNTYFSGIYGNYNGIYDYFTKGYFYENTLDFPVIPNIKSAEYKIQNYIEPYLNDNNLVAIERMGILNDNRAKLDFEQKLNEPYISLIENDFEKAEGNFSAKYTLDNKTHTIVTAKLGCNIAINQERKIKCEIQLVSNN